MRLVLDTNVVISGLLWRSPSARLIDLAIEQAVTICANPFLADDLAEKLTMPTFTSRIATAGMTPERRQQDLSGILQRVRPRRAALRSPPCRDDLGAKRTLLQRETDFQRNLPVRHLAVDHLATGLGDAEPVNVADRFMRLRDRHADGVFNAHLR